MNVAFSALSSVLYSLILTWHNCTKFQSVDISMLVQFQS